MNKRKQDLGKPSIVSLVTPNIVSHETSQISTKWCTLCRCVKCNNNTMKFDPEKTALNKSTRSITTLKVTLCFSF